MGSEFKMDREELDRKLNSPGQIQIREVVHSLPEDTLSLTWRSDLNTSLRAAAARRKKQDLFGWIWKPAVGAVMASALAFALFFHPTVTSVGSSGDLEKALVSHYVDSTNAREVAGDGVTPNEAKDSAGSSSVSVDWDQEDVGATL